MNRDDSVLCASCGREFTVGLLEMVRERGPLWCKACRELADSRLVDAERRARKAQEGTASNG